MKTDSRFIEAVRLFNAGEFFESHEVLEELWLETPDEAVIRNFYKGFIQCAGALYLLRRGTLGGAKALCQTAVGYLEAYAPDCLGLDVSRLLVDMRTCFQSDLKSPKFPAAYFC